MGQIGYFYDQLGSTLGRRFLEEQALFREGIRTGCILRIKEATMLRNSKCSICVCPRECVIREANMYSDVLKY